MFWVLTHARYYKLFMWIIWIYLHNQFRGMCHYFSLRRGQSNGPERSCGSPGVTQLEVSTAICEHHDSRVWWCLWTSPNPVLFKVWPRNWCSLCPGPQGDKFIIQCKRLATSLAIPHCSVSQHVTSGLVLNWVWTSLGGIEFKWWGMYSELCSSHV